MTHARWLLPTLILIGLGMSHAFASGNTTISQYCSNGTCSTPISINLANITTIGNFIKDSNVGLVLSQACITMEMHNITSDCITYDKLKPLEKVNPLLKGVWIDTPYPHKVYPTFKGVWNYYSGPSVILVDPPSDFMKRSRILTIESNSFTWQNPNDKNNNTQLVQHTGRFISSDCNEGIVIPYYPLIRDTALYMQSGCKDTRFNDVKIIHRAEIPFFLDSMNIKTISYMHQWGNTTKVTQDCIHFKCKSENPFHNHGFGW